MARVETNFAERNERASVCVEYVDASSQAAQDVRQVGVQTEECKESDDRQSNVDSPSSRYYESNESVSTSESELGMNSDSDACERSHKGVIIQKDSEIIVLKNELGVRNGVLDRLYQSEFQITNYALSAFAFLFQMKDDELEELREMNRHWQTLLEEKDKNEGVLMRNVNVNRYSLFPSPDHFD